MDILDSAKSLLGGNDGNTQNNLISGVMGLIGGQGSGIGGLVSQFASKGLGDTVNSWIGKGDNLPISPEQIKSVFGEETVNKFAESNNMNSDEAGSQLSNLLPSIIDKLTPDGSIPDGDILSKGKDLLGGIFGK